MKKFSLQKTSIEDLKILIHQPINDKRGFLSRIYCQDTFQDLTKNKKIQQINHTLTKTKGTVRGLHFQKPPFAETKFISCFKGKVWDVAVDLRKESSTFLQYHAEILCEGDHKSFIIPEGFAHGFQTLSSNCEMLYLHTTSYNSKFEGLINAVDPKLGIKWPELITERSSRDANQIILDDNFIGIEL